MSAHSFSERLNRFDWWKTGPLYQIYPRSFYDSNGDGVGDIVGIAQKLDYLEWLGVKNVWLSPIYKSPMADFGYDVSNYRDVDPIFGNLNDFKNLVAKMHSKGMKVIMDFIPNHTSIEHPWFLKSVKKIHPYTDYYVWHDGKIDIGTKRRTYPNNWQSVFGGPAWTWHPQRNQYYMHNFLPQQPNLNHRNPKVNREIKDIFEFWLNLGVDGFRLDAVIYLTHDPQYRNNPEESNDAEKGLTTVSKSSEKFDSDHPDHYAALTDWMKFLRDYGRRGNRHVFTVTEGYTSLTNYAKYYEIGVDFPFNFALSDWDAKISAENLRLKIQQYLDTVAYSTPQKNPSTSSEVAAAHSSERWLNWVLGNHDLPRISTRLGGPKFANLANMLLLLLPGTPVCYYGDELGMEDVPITFEQCQDPAGLKLGAEKYFKASRDPCRSPMPWNSEKNAGFTVNDKPWLPLSADFSAICVERQKSDPDSRLNFFRRLLAFRQATRSFLIGQFVKFVQSASNDEKNRRHSTTLAFFRSTDPSDLVEPIHLVILNFDPTMTGDDSRSLFHLDLTSSDNRYETGRLVLKTPDYDHAPLHSVVSLNRIPMSGSQGLVLEVLQPKIRKRLYSE